MTTANFTKEIIDLRPMLKLLTLRFTRDRDESLDLVQDTLMKALAYQDRFTNNTNLKGWLFTIMRNTFINNYRKDQRNRTSRDFRNQNYLLSIEDRHTFHSPQSSYEYHDILKHLDELKDEFQTPFKMHVSGYRYSEIADHLDIPIGTVKNRIFHARKEMQKKLVGY